MPKQPAKKSCSIPSRSTYCALRNLMMACAMVSRIVSIRFSRLRNSDPKGSSYKPDKKFAEKLCPNAVSIAKETFRVSSLLKLAGPIGGPALDDHLGLGEKLHRVFALTMQITKETILPATEWEERHRRCNADVDADIPGLRFIPKPTRRGAARRKHTSLIAILPTVDQFQRLFDGVRVHDTQHVAEHFGASQLTARRDVMQH